MGTYGIGGNFKKCLRNNCPKGAVANKIGAINEYDCSLCERSTYGPGESFSNCLRNNCPEG